MNTATMLVVSATAAVLFVVYVLLAGIDTIGRHLLVLGLVRLALLPSLAYVSASSRGRVGSWGWWTAAPGAALAFIGGGALAFFEGWEVDALVQSTPAVYPILVGVGGLLFTIGTVICGVRALSSGNAAIGFTAILAGLLYGAAAMEDAVTGHLIWIGGWLLLCGVAWHRSNSSAAT